MTLYYIVYNHDSTVVTNTSFLGDKVSGSMGTAAEMTPGSDSEECKVAEEERRGIRSVVGITNDTI